MDLPSPRDPLDKRLAPASVDRKAWLEQTFDVAFSLRICCSLVDKTITWQSLPLMSFAFPTYLPGVLLKSDFLDSLCLHPKIPKPGPPKFGGIAKCCASPAIKSTPCFPNSVGGFNPPSPSKKGSMHAIDRI